MADKPICVIPDCDNISARRGLCATHYRRLRLYGDPLKSIRTPHDKAIKHLNRVVLPYDGNECLIWPFYRNSAGYGMIRAKAANGYVHRMVCQIENGDPPSDEYEAAHLCGNGHLGCVSRKHLIWKTRKENSADKLLHGTHMRGERHPSSKVTDEAVRIIRSLRGIVSQRELSQRFGVSQGHVCRIQTGANWSWLD